MENNLRTYAAAGVTIKRFTYLRENGLIACKPDKGESYVIREDFLGDRSLLWVACINEAGKEEWRHSCNDMIRITYNEPI